MLEIHYYRVWILKRTENLNQESRTATKSNHMPLLMGRHCQQPLPQKAKVQSCNFIRNAGQKKYSVLLCGDKKRVWYVGIPKESQNRAARKTDWRKMRTQFRINCICTPSLNPVLNTRKTTRISNEMICEMIYFSKRITRGNQTTHSVRPGCCNFRWFLDDAASAGTVVKVMSPCHRCCLWTGRTGFQSNVFNAKRWIFRVSLIWQVRISDLIYFSLDMRGDKWISSLKGDKFICECQM